MKLFKLRHKRLNFKNYSLGGAKVAQSVYLTALKAGLTGVWFLTGTGIFLTTTSRPALGDHSSS